MLLNLLKKQVVRHLFCLRWVQNCADAKRLEYFNYNLQGSTQFIDVQSKHCSDAA